MWRVSEKNLNEAEEVAMGARNHEFSPEIYGRYIDRKFLWAIPTLLFLVAGKASRVPKVTYHFSLIVE